MKLSRVIKGFFSSKELKSLAVKNELVTESEISSKKKALLHDFDKLRSDSLDFTLDKIKVENAVLVWRTLFEDDIVLESAKDELLSYIDAYMHIARKADKLLEKSKSWSLNNSNDDIKRCVWKRTEGLLTKFANDLRAADYFRITGSLVSNSHISCVEMINGKGELGKFHVGDGIYPMKALPTIVKIIKERSDCSKVLNPSNYFIKGNHDFCRHSIGPVYVLPERLKAKAKNIESLFN